MKKKNIAIKLFLILFIHNKKKIITIFQFLKTPLTLIDTLSKSIILSRRSVQGSKYDTGKDIRTSIFLTPVGPLFRI